MPLANPVSANPFKLAFHVVLLFLGMLALVGFLIFSVVTMAMEGELRAQSEEEIILFTEIFENEGQDGLIKALKALSSGFEPQEHAVGLFDESLNRIEGNISLAPDFVGWRKVTLRLLRSGDKDLSFHAKAVKLQSFRLIVGRSSQIITGTQTQLLIWLGLSGFILTIGTLMLGWLSSKKSAQKLEVMDQALGAFAQGDMNARIAVNKNQDQIDAIALKMNTNIEQLSDLVMSMRTTASAIAHDLKTPLSHAQIALFEAIEACEQGQNTSLTNHGRMGWSWFEAFGEKNGAVNRSAKALVFTKLDGKFGQLLIENAPCFLDQIHGCIGLAIKQSEASTTYIRQNRFGMTRNLDLISDNHFLGHLVFGCCCGVCGCAKGSGSHKTSHAEHYDFGSFVHVYLLLSETLSLCLNRR